jgi:hypothetical protein
LPAPQNNIVLGDRLLPPPVPAFDGVTWGKVNRIW